MIDALTQPFVEFAFMRRALVGLFALSIGAPPIGVFLMLRRMKANSTKGWVRASIMPARAP